MFILSIVVGEKGPRRGAISSGKTYAGAVTGA